MKISKIYFGEDEETLLVQFDDYRLAECSADGGMEWDPTTRRPDFWTEVPLPSQEPKRVAPCCGPGQEKILGPHGGPWGTHNVVFE